jgi:hypothetical protein
MATATTTCNSRKIAAAAVDNVDNSLRELPHITHSTTTATFLEFQW